MTFVWLDTVIIIYDTFIVIKISLLWFSNLIILLVSLV